ncbi:hypothetical protein [Actinomadura syzygii]|uniref:Uncharacterized protein n=1 Tax=Actinomadura syzygii TaxID=1427538 RepID=A0A5D0TQX3_9ACTN|nr:hypothetical protein [Actinomadura syzygii]TYC08528.1 hypothetical protein FXF65_37145 [Actinomadura syzygii]
MDLLAEGLTGAEGAPALSSMTASGIGPPVGAVELTASRPCTVTRPRKGAKRPRKARAMHPERKLPLAERNAIVARQNGD